MAWQLAHMCLKMQCLFAECAESKGLNIFFHGTQEAGILLCISRSVRKNGLTVEMKQMQENAFVTDSFMAYELFTACHHLHPNEFIDV